MKKPRPAVTDEQLTGLAAQAANLAKRDMELNRFNFLFAVCLGGELHRMQEVEAVVVALLGNDWLNHGGKKDAAFGVFRQALAFAPLSPEAAVFGTAANMFLFTAKATPEQITELSACGHDRHHQAVREGLMEVHDSLTVIAQTPRRIVFYNQERDPEGGWLKAEVRTTSQGDFTGRLKLFGGAGMRMYTLIGQTPVIEEDIEVWMRWMYESDKLVQRTVLPGHVVSTIFLGLDHDWSGDGPPLLFETMVFDGVIDDYQKRWSTWAEAEAGHVETLRKFSAHVKS